MAILEAARRNSNTITVIFIVLPSIVLLQNIAIGILHFYAYATADDTVDTYQTTFGDAAQQAIVQDIQIVDSALTTYSQSTQSAAAQLNAEISNRISEMQILDGKYNTARVVVGDISALTSSIMSLRTSLRDLSIEILQLHDLYHASETILVAQFISNQVVYFLSIDQVYQMLVSVGGFCTEPNLSEFIQAVENLIAKASGCDGNVYSDMTLHAWTGECVPRSESHWYDKYHCGLQNEDCVARSNTNTCETGVCVCSHPDFIDPVTGFCTSVHDSARFNFNACGELLVDCAGSTDYDFCNDGVCDCVSFITHECTGEEIYLCGVDNPITHLNDPLQCGDPTRDLDCVECQQNAPACVNSRCICPETMEACGTGEICCEGIGCVHPAHSPSDDNCYDEEDICGTYENCQLTYQQCSETTGTCYCTTYGRCDEPYPICNQYLGATGGCCNLEGTCIPI